MRRMIPQKQIETLQNINISENSVDLGQDVQFLINYRPNWSNIQLKDENDNLYPLTEPESIAKSPYIRISQHMLSLQYGFTGNILLGFLKTEDIATFNKNRPTTLYITHDDGMNGAVQPSTLQTQQNVYKWDEDEEAYILQNDFQTIGSQQIYLYTGPGSFVVQDDF